jgi:hypothetical protein
LAAGVVGPKAIARASRWAWGVNDPSSICAVDPVGLRAQRQKVVDAWQAAGRSAPPHFSTNLWFALGTDAHERLAAYVYSYMRIFGEGLAREVAGSATVHSRVALRDAADKARQAGCDELFLVPTTTDPNEVDQAREAVGSEA